MSDTTPFVELQCVSKHFGGYRAVDDVSLSIMPGTVCALVGENGAGKSTVGKIVAGAITPDAGRLVVDGRAVSFRSPANALKSGIALIQQELALAPDLSVSQNIVLGAEDGRFGFLSRRDANRRVAVLLEETGFDLPLDDPVGSLRLAQQQEVTILWALARNARLIIMDEPTAALPKPEAESLHRVIRHLCRSGVAVVFISHFLEEVLLVADEVTVMRNGRCIETLPAADATVERLIVGMLGRELESTFPALPATDPSADVVLAVEGLTQPDVLTDIELSVRRGEILGIFGLMGSGRSELAHALSGAVKRVTGEVRVCGRAGVPQTPRQAIERGVMLLPESRKDQGLFLSLSQYANANAASIRRRARAGFVMPSTRAAVREMLQSVQVDPLRLDESVDVLSGGNQQKVLFAKCLLADPVVLILDEPTRGVDIGSKLAIYKLIVGLAERGTAVLLISSELDEVRFLSHRILVMRGGRIAATFDAPTTDQDSLLGAAFGLVAADRPLQQLDKGPVTS